MEVHHPHHPSHKKKIQEYLLEFFMLFLAVSLGFLAENIREHYVEKERAHELVESFMKDVETNIKFTDSILSNNQKMIIKNDSSLYYIMSNPKINLDSFFQLLPSTSYRYINNNDTYDQMKSSGSLRYIRDTLLLRKIISYNNASKAAEFRSITQEFEYTAHEYVDAIQKWMPPEIAIKRQTSILISRKYFKMMIESENQKSFIEKLNNVKDNENHWIEGNDLKRLKKELVPVISRKIWLMSASQLYIHTAADQAKDLLDYYHKNIVKTH